MRSLARDMREGIKRVGYKIKWSLYDGEGGYCAMGAAFLGAGVGNMDSSDYPSVWKEQYHNGIITDAVIINNKTEATLHDIVNFVEQEEWEKLGIPTEQMRLELEKSVTEPELMENSSVEEANENKIS